MPITREEVVAVIDLLEAAGVSVSVAGGCAVDALVGRVTREHGDLDLAVDTREIDQTIAALAAMGYRVDVDERPARLVLRAGERRVDLHPVRWRADGVGRQSNSDGEEYVYPPGSTEAAGRIGDREVRCLTPELLVTFHLGYEPREIDRRDMALLAERFRFELPDPYQG